ncbi:MAG: hypothetical protein QCI00_08355 [Candidatus Thermoplasmatota archaeon]|nr:hypothetical protein [Candidatus Thermoplasmatota archaeon]
MSIGIDALKGLKNCFEIAFSSDDMARDFYNALQNGAKELKKTEEKP